MKKTMKRVVLVCWCATLLVMLSACSPETGKIKKTLADFQAASEALDIEGMLECVDPDVAQPIRKTVTAYTALTGTDPRELLPTVVQMVFGEESDGEKLMDHISIKKPKLHISGDTAQVECELHITTEDSSYSRDTVIRMKKIDDKWYIAGLGGATSETE